MTYYVDAKYDFSSLKAWNGLFSDFRKSTDLDNEKKDDLLRKIYRKMWVIRLIGLVGTSRAENLNIMNSVCAKYDFNNLKDWNGLFSDFRKSTDLAYEKTRWFVTKNL